jgi:soluble lytic murein transglycosylase-like protein
MPRGRTILAAVLLLAVTAIAGFFSQTEARRNDENGVTSYRRGDLQHSTVYKTNFNSKKTYKRSARKHKYKRYAKNRYGKAAKRYRYGKVAKRAHRYRQARVERRHKTARRGSPHLIASVKSHARAAGVPVRVALAIVHQESGFNQYARGGVGEIGLMQIRCSTARGMGYRGSCGGLYNVATNLRWGMRYLRMALNRGSVAYYNAGIHARRLPAAARRYARSVNARI